MNFKVGDRVRVTSGAHGRAVYRVLKSQGAMIEDRVRGRPQRHCGPRLQLRARAAPVRCPDRRGRRPGSCPHRGARIRRAAPRRDRRAPRVAARRRSVPRLLRRVQRASKTPPWLPGGARLRYCHRKRCKLCKASADEANGRFLIDDHDRSSPRAPLISAREVFGDRRNFAEGARLAFWLAAHDNMTIRLVQDPPAFRAVPRCELEDENARLNRLLAALARRIRDQGAKLSRARRELAALR